MFRKRVFAYRNTYYNASSKFRKKKGAIKVFIFAGHLPLQYSLFASLMSMKERSFLWPIVC